MKTSLTALVLMLTLSGQSLAQERLDVTITGLSGEPELNVQAALKIAQHTGDKTLSAKTIRELHNGAKREIRRALQPFGYYRPTITAELLPPEHSVEAWRANYTIVAGSAVPLDKVDIQFTGAGANDNALISLSERSPLRKDQTLDHRRYEEAKRALLAQTRALSYLDASYTQRRVEVDMARYSATVQLHIDTGPQYIFGAIEFEPSLFASEYLAQYLVVQPGEPFTQSQVTRQRSALSKSGHFQEVIVELGEATNSEKPAIPLHIQLVPFKPNRYRGHLGWGSDTGFGVQADWTRRYIGRYGHHFNVGGTVVEDRNRLAGDLSYMIPLNPLREHSIELAARHESKDLTFEDVELDEGGETRIATNLVSTFWHLPEKRLGEFEVKRTAGLSVVGETYDVFEVLFGNLPSNAQDAIIDSIGSEAYDTLSPKFEALVLAASYTLRRSDNPLYIRRGDYLKLELLGTDQSLGSNIDFWQLRLSSWNIRPMGDRGRLLLRSAVGYTDAESRQVLGVNFNQMPEYYEFRAGGARSVRGYGFETLYPGNAITGGKHQLVASIEYEHEIIPDWSVAIFLDGGNAFNDFDDIDAKLGTGIGIRWRSPVGLARIDLGFPLDDADDAFQIYITVGPEF